jgi:arylsulfatase A-like enzyme
LVAAFVVIGCGSHDEEAATTVEIRPPNILLILVDALRRDYVGLYDHPQPTTPFVDEFDEGGVVFDDALSQAPQTLNSTASLFTSRHFPYLLWGVEHDPVPGVAPERRDQWARTPRLAAANLTLAETLQRGGYQTVALFNNPHHHPTSGFDQGFDDARLLDRDPGQAYARVDSVVEAFLSWHQRADPQRPYFAYLHLMEPHNPYRPPEAYREIFPPGPGRHLYANGPPDESFTAADLATMKALYSAEIRFLDDGLRELVTELEQRSGLENTLIVITADHGEELLDHGGLGHGKTVELEQLRIPLILGGGAVKARAGTRVENPVRNLDLPPTLVELAGLEIPVEFEGRSLVPLIRGTEADNAPPTLSFAWNARLRSLTTSEWHCMQNLATGELALIHRPSDPAGMTDVAEDSPDLAALCIRELDRLEAENEEARQRAKVLKAIETGGEMPAESDKVLEQLKALGYVE